MKKTLLKDWWKYLLGVAIIIFHVLPIYVLVVMAFKSMSDSSSLLSLPEKVYTANFVKVFQSGNIPSALRNTIIVTVCVLLIEIVVGGLASYPLSRNKSKWNGLIKRYYNGDYDDTVSEYPGRCLFPACIHKRNIHSLGNYPRVIRVRAPHDHLPLYQLHRGYPSFP